ncbi:MAG: hypothetical protein ABIH39_03185 [Candidatus Margulisiibacteriota bacterium]
MQIGAIVSGLIGVGGIVLGLLNKKGGNVPESMDILFYLVGAAGLIAAGVLFFMDTKKK